MLYSLPRKQRGGSRFALNRPFFETLLSKVNLLFEAFENPLNLIKNCFLAFFVELVIMYNKTIVINPV